ncbi:hypothetical protein PT974_02879 [Cladobotryum mycophilum]|uniref:Uncharacterized protein n=1 Tax=Cladobotryum mycophilum TaxID=491253 RepID=A0ABR0T0N3_9HYPO
METLISYTLGLVRVRLSQFVPDDNYSRYASNGIIVSGLEGILQNPHHQILGHIGTKTRDELLKALNITADQFRNTINSDALNIVSPDVYCLVNKDTLQAVRDKHDGRFECIIRVCWLPPPPEIKLSDGDIFQQIRHFANERRFDVAQHWMNRLSKPKRRHLTFIISRPAILSVLDELLSFPGLWIGLQLGNWAKHLAAHIDELILNYLDYIKQSYLQIFEGYENLAHLLDESTVVQLQYRAPKWCATDRNRIQDAFQKGTLFKNIQSPDARDTLKENVLSFNGVIPSIQTFHENMKYISIGAKILEKYIEIKPTGSNSQRGDITRTKPSLLQNLRGNWRADRAMIEAGHGNFIPAPAPSADLSAMQLFIAALRYFPLLCLEGPLQDRDGGWMGAKLDSAYLSLLCRTASRLGFNNKKIQDGSVTDTPKIPTYRKRFTMIQWRGGKPAYGSYDFLFHHSFLPMLFGQPFQSSQSAGPLHIQSDMFRAFFKYTDYPSTITGQHERQDIMSGERSVSGQGNDTEESGGEDDAMNVDENEDVEMQEAPLARRSKKGEIHPGKIQRPTRGAQKSPKNKQSKKKAKFNTQDWEQHLRENAFQIGPQAQALQAPRAQAPQTPLAPDNHGFNPAIGDPPIPQIQPRIRPVPIDVYYNDDQDISVRDNSDHEDHPSIGSKRKAKRNAVAPPPLKKTLLLDPTFAPKALNFVQKSQSTTSNPIRETQQAAAPSSDSTIQNPQDLIQEASVVQDTTASISGPIEGTHTIIHQTSNPIRETQQTADPTEALQQSLASWDQDEGVPRTNQPRIQPPALGEGWEMIYREPLIDDDSEGDVNMDSRD